MESLIKKILKPTFWQVTSRLITGVVSFVLTLILTRSLGLDSFGDFTKILALVTIFYLPADFGLNAAFVKFASSNNSKTSKLFFNLFVARLILALFWLVASLITAASLYGASLSQILASATILTTAVTTTALGYYQLKLSYHWPALANFTGAVVTLFLLWYFFENLNLTIAFAAILAGQVVAALVNFSKIWHDLRFLAEKVNFLQIKKYFAVSFALGLTLIFNLIYFKADIVILSVFKPASSVGLYGLSVRIFEWLIIPAVFLGNSTFPILTKAYNRNLADFAKLAKYTITILLLASLVVFLLIYFTAGTIITFVGGSEFGKSSAALKILLAGLPAFYLTSILMWLLVILDKRIALVLIYAAGALLNIVLNLIFIPKFDFLAAAVTTVFSEVLILVAVSLVLINFLRKQNISHSP